MQYSRAGARRRRVLASEAVGAEADSVASLPPESRSAAAVAAAAGRYADGAVDYRQPRITDLIPRRRLTLFLLAASLLSVLLGLENLYGYVFVLPYPGNRQALAALDLQRSGNIADWCASASMLVCAAASLLVFAVRRHRTDDYRGVYYCWIWLAALFCACSVWLAAPLRAAAAEGIGFLTSRPAAEVEAYCVLGALLIVVLAALRMALEMRESRAAVFFLAVAGCGWALASAQRVGLLAPNSPLGAMVRVAALLGAQVAMLTAILSYARRVCLEAEGRLAAPSARAKPDKKKKRADAQTAPKKTRSRTQKLPKDAGAAPAPGSAGPSGATAARRRTKSESASAPSSPTTAASKAKTLSMVGNAPKPAAASPDPSADDFDENSPEFANLNKSERRRLRKLKRRDRRTAA